MARLGNIPSVGDRFEWDGVSFEVMDMDGHRVERVLATPPVEGIQPPAGTRTESDRMNTSAVVEPGAPRLGKML